jgi:hypothetical protein
LEASQQDLAALSPIQRHAKVLPKCAHLAQ